MIRSTVAFALSVLRQIRAEAAKDTLATVNAQLPMDVAFYLLNQKRKEIAQLEEEYNLTLNLVGNPLARQNEHSMEFVRRTASEDKTAPVAEKGTAKESKESPARSTAGSGHRRRSRSARVEEPATYRRQNRRQRPFRLRCRPLSSTPRWQHPRTGCAGGFSGDSTRIRGVWKVTATANQPVAKAGARSGRQTAGRLARRARGWWRRRTSSQTAQSDTAAKQESAPVSEPVEAARE